MIRVGDKTFVVHDHSPMVRPAKLVLAEKLTRAEMVALAAECLKHLNDPEWQPDEFWFVIEDDSKGGGA